MRWLLATVTALLAVALAASVAAGLLGLWPRLRGPSLADRREKVRVATAAEQWVTAGWLVSRVRLRYLPRHALVEFQKTSSGRRACVLIPDNFGAHVDREDVKAAPCDF